MSYLSPEAYLPHDAPMMLLESVENVTDDTGRVNTFQPSAEELTSLFNQGSNA